MRPFNPLVTRDGRKILDFHYFKNVKELYPIIAVVDGESSIRSYTEIGRCFRSETESKTDLLMYEEPKTYYVNIYREKDRRPYMGTCYESFEDAKKMAEEPINKNYIKTIEFTI